jgi:serine/threonine protein kinase
MPELPLVGDEFAGYRLRAVLGRGGMSTVYQAENPRLGNVIALKVLAPELATDDVFRTRFLEESRIAAAMNHPHVIPIHDMGSTDGLLYIAMRCVSGTDLRQMIAKRGRLLPDTAIFLLSQAARALDAAHRRGLVHRDVKPGNLLTERGADDSDPDHTCTWRTSGSRSRPSGAPARPPPGRSSAPSTTSRPSRSAACPCSAWRTSTRSAACSTSA